MVVCSGTGYIKITNLWLPKNKAANLPLHQLAAMGPQMQCFFAWIYLRLNST